MKKKPSGEIAPGGPLPRRYSTQQQQEQLAIAQLKVAFHGWNLNPIANDLGEDLLVQIYDDGRYTGLSFFLQLKSVSSLRAHHRKNSPEIIVYSKIYVKDLLHWADSVPVVIVLVWDVNQSTGYWQDIPSIIRHHDAHQANWRSRTGTISIILPKANGTDKAGRSALRARLADIALPQFSKGKTLEVTSKLSFNTQSLKDQKLLIDLQHIIDEGGAITIPSRNIKDIQFSGWFERAYGRRAVSEISIAPLRKGPPLKIGFRAASPENTEVLYLAMSKTKAGSKSVTFETIDNEQPLSAALKISTDRKSFLRIDLKLMPGQVRDVCTALVLARFELALREYPKITLLMPDGYELGPVAFATSPFETEPASLRAWIGTLQKLSFIQARVIRFGRFDLTGGLRSSDLSDIEFLFAICSGNHVKTRMTVTALIEEGAVEIVKGPAGRSLREPGMARMTLNQFDNAPCLNVYVPLGHCEIIFSDTLAFVETFNQAVKSQSQKLQFVDAEVILHFRDWIPPHEGPKQPSTIIGIREDSAY